MEKLIWGLPVLRSLTPLRRGLVEAAALMALLWLLSFLLLRLLGPLHPSAGILQTLAQIGATLLIAYVVEVTWLVESSRGEPLDEREKRVGALMGVAAAVLLGVAVAVVLAGHVAADQWEQLDELGLSFVSGTLVMVGIAVVMRPMLAHERLNE